MRLTRLIPLALALTLGGTTVQAQAANDPDVAAAQGKDPMPAGWTLRLDRANADKSTLRFFNAGTGMHVTSGPAAIFWDAKNTTTVPFTAEVTFTQTKKPTHPEAYGLIWGGKNLEAENQEYFYLIVRGDGKYMIKHRAGTETHELAPWTEHAGVAKENAQGQATTTLKVEATAAGTKLYANGQLLKELPTNATHNGIVGLRVNHNLDMHIEGFSVKKQ